MCGFFFSVHNVQDVVFGRRRLVGCGGLRVCGGKPRSSVICNLATVPLNDRLNKSC